MSKPIEQGEPGEGVLASPSARGSGEYPAAHPREDILPVVRGHEADEETPRARARESGRSAWLASVLNGAGDPIAATDAAGTIVDANPAMEVTMGRPLSELVGQPLTGIVTEADRRRTGGAVWAALRGETALLELRCERAGAPRRVAFHLGPIRGPQGAVVGVVAVGRDVSDQKVVEAGFALADKLATVGRLAASVVHEINNPLSAILVYADHLTRKLKANGEGSDAARAERISEAAARIQALVRRLLAYAPSQADAPRPIGLGQVVGQASLFCEHVLRERAVTLESHVPMELPDVVGVASELTQVLVNLITNACHASPPTGGRVHIAARALGGDRVELTVQDNGHGIPAAYLDRVFEPFFTTKRKGAGTGLGLAIVRSVVDQHRGEIHVQSDPGAGTRFTIVLPAAGGGLPRLGG